MITGYDGYHETLERLTLRGCSGNLGGGFGIPLGGA
jgi:hypothetical protein